MINKFEQIELDITKEIINIGISKAADSLSFFINEKVMIRLVDVKINTTLNFPFSKKATRAKNYLLSTAIRGDIKGKAYLFFDEEEANKIVEKHLSEKDKNDPVIKAKMTEAFLLEIDNIITASVVTQFSNIFQAKFYGDVPFMDILPDNEINSFLSAKHEDDGLNQIYFNAQFVTENMAINPEFIWMMEDKFYEEIKKVVSDEKKLELVEKLNAICI